MNYLHECELGDIILSLASVQADGGGNYYIQNNPNAVKMLKPLIELQPYIDKCEEYNGQHIDKSFVDFRKGGLEYGYPLALNHANWIKVKTDVSKQWLFVPKDNKFNNKIIINRTYRYCNPLFNWKQIVEKYKDLILFVGLDYEYNYFCESYGNVDRLLIDNYLDLAIAINSSFLFIGNQSSSNCVNEGLKHNSIQEVCLWQPDCIYKRDNAIFCYDGNIDATISGNNFLIKRKQDKQEIDTSLCPNGGWNVTINEKNFTSYCFQQLKQFVKNDGIKINDEDLNNEIFKYSNIQNNSAILLNAFMPDIKRIESILK